MESHIRGDATEATVIAELKRRAIPVSKPVGDNERYDIVVEAPGGRLLRVQIKTGWVQDGKIEFHGKSQHTNSDGNTYEKYENDVDYFFVYTPELEALHVVGEWEFDSSIRLRVEEPEQVHHTINWAEDYEFESRWPLHGENRRTGSSSETLDAVVAALEEHDVDLARSVTLDGADLLVERESGELCRVGVETGWVQGGRVRFNPRQSLDRGQLDWFVVHVAELERVYLVGPEEFDKSISLRVEEPAQHTSQVNWAEEYELEERVEVLR